MSRAARSIATLSVLGVLLVVGGAWGWSALTKPLPGDAEPSICAPTAVAQGERVTPSQVLVSVLNAGDRDGLAGRTMQQLTDDGFGEGDLRNAPAGTNVKVAQIWTDEPSNPAVRLVLSHLPRGAQVKQRATSVAGVVVVVGDGFTKVKQGKKAVQAQEDAEICVPTADPTAPAA